MAILYVINKIFLIIYLIVDLRYPRHTIIQEFKKKVENIPNGQENILNQQNVNDPIDQNDPIVNDPINQVALNSIAKFHPKSDNPTDKIATFF